MRFLGRKTGKNNLLRQNGADGKGVALALT
jgi:hypothetical protein